MSNKTEAEFASDLVSRILLGDLVAEQEMVNRYARGLKFMLRQRAHDDALAEDISQETWRIIIEKIRLRKLREPAKLSAFIVQTAKNQLIMHYRSSHIKKMDNELEVEQLTDCRDESLQLLEKQRLKSLVHQLISELKTPRDREIIMRYYVQEEAKACICKDYELDELHFNRVLFRARQRFKELWMKSAESN